ncbi:MAG: hypothetical protein FD180_1662 [Planctomycetota bacterium]|nr:MAG: hypothetical protein FD180_1662 [Planctomycetota bacterium]
MICPKCGSEIPAGPSACPGCAAIPVAAFPPPPAGAPRGRTVLPWQMKIVIPVAFFVFAALPVGLVALRMRLARRTGPSAMISGALCTFHLSKLGEGCREYRRKHGAWPADLKTVYEAESLAPSAVICPFTEDSPSDDARGRPWKIVEDRVSYFYRPPPPDMAPDGPDEIPMAWDLEEHPRGTRQVLFSSGRVEEMNAKQFESHFRK